MIKSKLIIVISSIGLVGTLGIGCFFLNSNKEITKDNVIQAEITEETLKDVVKEDSTKESNTNNVTNEEDKLTKEDANLSEEVINNNNKDLNNEVENSAEEIESRVEGIGNINPSYNNSSKEDSSNNINSNIQSEVQSNSTAVSDSSYIAEIEQAIFQRVNEERIAAGLSALSYNNTMEKYARIKSKDMGDNGYFSHEDEQGNLITEKMKEDGVSYRAWGENIAYIQGMDSNSSLASKFMDNWMNSSGHRANILSTNFTSIGIGVYKIGNTYYATQEFYK